MSTYHLCSAIASCESSPISFSHFQLPCTHQVYTVPSFHWQHNHPAWPQVGKGLTSCTYQVARKEAFRPMLAKAVQEIPENRSTGEREPFPLPPRLPMVYSR